MEKCEICGKETSELYECSNCGRLVCAECGGEIYYCDECLEQDDYNSEKFHGPFW